MRLPARSTVLVFLASSSVLFPAAPTPADWVKWFSDDFEDGTMRRWRIDNNPDPQAQWSVEKDGGNSVFAGRGHIFARPKVGRGSDYRLKACVRIIRGGIHLNVRDDCTRYFIGIVPNRIYLNRTRPCQQHQELRSIDEPIQLNRWYTVEIVATGSDVKVYLDDALKISFNDPNPVWVGDVTFEALEGDGYVQVDDVEITGPAAAPGALRIRDAWIPDAVIGVPFVYRLSAEGGVPSYLWAIAPGLSLPRGLMLIEDGIIQGTPTGKPLGAVTVLVTDNDFTRAAQLLNLNVDDAGITSPRMLPPGEVGKPYSTKFEASGIRGCQWVGMMIPPGLAINPATGEMSGVPALGGVYQMLVACLTAQGISGYALPSFYATEPNPPPLAFVLGTDELFAVQAPGRSAATPILVAGGTPPYSFRVTAGELPPGMSLLTGDANPGEGDPFQGAIAGRATATGKYRFTVEAADSAGLTASQEYELPVTWMSTDAPDDLLTLGTPFSADLPAEGGIPPYKWTGLVVPAGLAISESGNLSGAPTECGFLGMFAQATDSDNPPVTQRVSTGFATLCVPNSFSQMDIHLPRFPPKVKLGEPYELRIGVGSGSGRSFRLGLSSGALPPGLTLGEGALPGLYVISGTPTRTGAFECFLRATDDAGAFGVRRLQIMVE